MRNTERGAVALITAMVVSILLLITTSGMVALTLKSLRGSTDGAQSTKAYYAAEGGLEEALLKLRHGELADNCPGSTNTEQSAKDGVVTCIKVTPTSNQVTGKVDADGSTQIDLSGVAGIKTITVEWTTPEGAVLNTASIPPYIDGAGNSNFVKRGDTWPATAPAVVEVGVVEFREGEFTVNDVKYEQGTFAPKSTNANATFTGSGIYSYRDGNALKKPIVTPCNKAGDYPCVGAIGNIDINKRYMLRLKTRYNGMRYRVSVQGEGNVPLAIPGEVYNIDVTARAGETFRRIQTSFSKDSNPTSLPGLDYVLYSDTDICKSFELQGTSPIGINCNPPF